MKEYYKNNPEQRKKVVARMKVWKKNNPAKLKISISKYNEKHKDQHSLYYFEKQKRLKLKVLGYYGFCCACCGENNYEFLSVDHINNDGHKHIDKNERRFAGTSLYLWLVKNNFPPGFQILCFNCNFSKGIYGICPHQIAREI